MTGPGAQSCVRLSSFGVWMVDPDCGVPFGFNLKQTNSAALPPTNMTTDRGSLQKEIHLPGTFPQVPCWLEEGYP